MKASKTLLSIVIALLVSVFSGVAFSMPLETDPMVISGVVFAAQLIPFDISGLSLAGVYVEVWTKRVIQELDELEEATFLDGIEDYSSEVNSIGNEAQAIHATFMGVLPDVLINNTTYPIPEQGLDEEDVVITLDKYQTKVTPISDDSLYALSYDKINTVKSKHAKAIDQKKYDKAIHSFGPADGTNPKMPVIKTTGDNDGTGRKRLIRADILSLKKACDDLKMPKKGRRLVLSNDHINDILLFDQAFKDQYYNYTSGKIANMYGFEVYEYTDTPLYAASTSTKKAFGSTPVAGDYNASIMFSMARVAKAKGWVKMYYSESKTDPGTQTNRVNFRHYYIAMPTREEGRGAIISDTAV